MGQDNLQNFMDFSQQCIKKQKNFKTRSSWKQIKQKLTKDVYFLQVSIIISFDK